MISLKQRRTLDLAAPLQRGRKPHLSAASGLVRMDSRLFVIADDELSLGVFQAEGDEPGEAIRLFSGELPLDPAARKDEKADFEALLALPPFPGFEQGALFALPSGSKKKKRHQAALLRLSGTKSISAGVTRIDLAEAYAPLHREFARLNIEGAVVHDGELRLFQRGNKKDRVNAIVRCRLAPVLESLALGRGLGALEVLGIAPVELPELESIPLSFTDAAVLRNGDMVFTAAAEDTDNPEDDNVFSGSAIGIVTAAGELRSLEEVSERVKLEGIAAAAEGAEAELLLVSDADNADIAAPLFSARIETHSTS
jgi:hypothetical protein